MHRTLEKYAQGKAKAEEVKEFMEHLEGQYPVDLWMHYNHGANVIILSKIIVEEEERGKGVGTDVMRYICAYADVEKMRIALTPASDFGGSKNRLVKFYKEFGFKKYKGYEFRETMVRDPQ